MELPCIIDVIQLPGTAGGKRLRIIPHLRELDAGILGKLLPQEIQPLSRCALHLYPSIHFLFDIIFLGRFIPILARQTEFFYQFLIRLCEMDRVVLKILFQIPPCLLYTSRCV